MKKTALFLTILPFLFMGGCASGPSRPVKGAEEDIAIFPQPGMGVAIRAECSPDKKRFISSQMDGSIKIWDTESGRLIRSIQADKTPVYNIAWSRDSSMFLSCGIETLKVWNAQTFREISSSPGFSFSAAFSQNGRIIAAGTQNGTVKLLNASTGKKIREITVRQTEDEDSMFTAICFSPDGKQLAVSELASAAGTIKIFNVATGALITTLAEIDNLREYFEDGEVQAEGTALAFNPNGKRLAASLFGGKKVHVYDTMSGKELFTLAGHEKAVNSAVFSPDGAYIATGSIDNTIKIWDSEKGRELFSHSLGGIIHSLSFKDNRYILTSAGGSLVEIDLRNGEEVRSFYSKGSSSLGSSFSPRGDIFSGKKVWYQDGSAPVELEALANVNTLSAAYSPDGKILAVLVGDKKDENTDENKTPAVYIVLINAENRNVIKKLSEFNFVDSWNITGTPPLAFSTDGRRIASGSPYGRTFLWDIESGELIWERPLHKGAVTHIAFSTGGLIASCSTDGTLKIWDERTLIAKTYPGFDDKAILNVVFNPDGEAIAVSYTDKIMLFDIQSGKEIWTAKENGGAFAMAFNPGKKHILAQTFFGLCILDAETGKAIQKLSWEGSMFVFNAAYSPDGKYFYLNSVDGYSSVWDAAANREIAQFVSFEDGEWIVITSEGYYNASPNGDQYLNLRVGNKVYGVDQYREIFYRPEIVQAIFSGGTPSGKMTLKNAALITPPVVSVKTPADTVSTLTTKLQVSISDQNNPIETIRIMVNGRHIGQDELPGFRGNGLKVEKTSLTVSGKQKNLDFELPVNLKPGKNVIDVLAFNGYSWSSRARTSIECENTQPGELDNLWILAIGINRYEPSSTMKSLSYCVSDAEEIVKAFRRQEGIQYTKVNWLLITDNTQDVKPTAADIKREMPRFLAKASSRDLVILFLAGHGVDVSGSFVFLPRDASFEDGIPTASTTISNEEILKALDISPRRLVFIDACHSGGVTGGKTAKVDNSSMIRALRKNDAFIFAAASDTQSSFEYLSLEHGVFTFNILEALKGKANPADNTVGVYELTSFVTKEVRKKTNNLQTPRATSLDFADFPVARTK